MRLYVGNKVYSSWSLRPWLVMKAKAIAFEEQLIPLRDSGSSDRIRQVSPSGKVPCLVDGKAVVWETTAIMEYLAEKFPKAEVWPEEQGARAHARSVAAEMHAGFTSLRKHCPMVMTQRFKPQPLPTEVQADVTRITQIWNEARTQFTGRSHPPFLYGEFTAADGMYAPVVSRFHTYGIRLDAVSQAYVDAMRAHPAYQEWLAGAVAEPWVLAQNETETIIEDLRAKK